MIFNMVSKGGDGGGSVTQDQDGYIVLPSTGGGGGVTAELIQSWSYDKWIVEDEEIDLPSYSTNTQTLISSETLSPAIPLDASNYYYFLIMRGLTYPSYSTSTKYAGKPEYTIYTYIAALGSLPANTFRSFDGTASSNTVDSIADSSACPRVVYWISSSSIGFINAQYGGTFTPTAPTFSSNPTRTVSIKTPTLNSRGHATYCTETAYNEITDIRFQYILEVYRTPRQNTLVNISGHDQANVERVLDCIYNNNKKLI